MSSLNLFSALVHITSAHMGQLWTRLMKRIFILSVNIQCLVSLNSIKMSCYTEGVAKLSIPAAAQLFHYVLAKGNSTAISFPCKVISITLFILKIFSILLN